VDDFAVIVRNHAEWKMARREGNESFALLEAAIPARDETAGTLLLRSAWNGDAVIDLLGTNPRLAGEVAGIGIMLIAAACSIARDSGAPLLFVETARHSTGYWQKFLQQGTPFIRFDESGVAFDRARAILDAGRVNYVQTEE
jgi:hypothetical protein